MVDDIKDNHRLVPLSKMVQTTINNLSAQILYQFFLFWKKGYVTNPTGKNHSLIQKLRQLFEKRPLNSKSYI